MRSLPRALFVFFRFHLQPVIVRVVASVACVSWTRRGAKRRGKHGEAAHERRAKGRARKECDKRKDRQD